MVNGAKKKLTHKAIRNRSRIGAIRVPYKSRRLLHNAGLAGTRHNCYACSRRGRGLPNLEAKARFQLVKKEGCHG